MRGFWIAAVLISLAGATPAAAADIATLGCVRDQMTAPVRAEIAASARDLADGKTAAASPEMRAALQATAKTCAARHGWSDAARDAAQTHALVSVSLDTVRPLAKGRGVSLDIFDAALHALTEAQRTQILAQDTAGTDALIAELKRRGMPVIGEAQGSLIGVVAVLTLFQESQRAHFVAS